MAVSTGSFVKDLMPFIGKWFGDEYKDYDQEYSQVFKVEKATSKFVEDPLMSGLDVARVKAEGDNITYDDMGQRWVARYEMVTYGTGIQVTREMVEDAQSLSMIEKGTRQIKRALVHAIEREASLVLDRCTTSGYTGGDGVVLASASHPTSAGNKSNTQSADLSESSLEQAIIDIADYRDDRGLLIDCRASKLVIPTALQFDAARILKSDLRVSTADNDANALKTLDILQSKPVVMHRLTDTDTWFIVTDVPDGLKCYMRREPDIGQDNEFDTENARIKGTCRFKLGWTDWRGVYCSIGV
jgi:hypothetical protein